MAISAEIKNSLETAYNHFNPKVPVTPSSSYYVNCDDARGEQGENVAQRMAAELSLHSNDYAHFLFTGHVGSGKSSELLKVKDMLETEYNFRVIYFDAEEALDLYNVHHTDLLLAIAAQLFKAKEISLDARTLQNVQDWFKEITKTTTETTAIGAELEAGVEAGSGFPLLGKLFANFSADIRRDKEQRAEIRERFKARVTDLLMRVNRLIEAARQDVRRKGLKDVVLIIDNLEKMSPNLLQEEKQHADTSLFIDYGNLLSGLESHLICTVPIRLLYLPIGSKLFDDFSRVYTLPVIKIKNHDGNPQAIGLSKFQAIVTQRLRNLPHLEHLAFFNNEEALLDQVAQFCGGNVKSFIRIMRQIVFQATVEQRIPADQALLDKVFRQEMRDYDRLISSDRIRRLVRVAYTHEIDISENSPDSEMLQLGWILVYANAKEWCDVEPVIRRLERFNKEWQAVTTTPIQ